jgi:glutamate formiminotransferase/formiminotetrahydrofolate cyclodeaminase
MGKDMTTALVECVPNFSEGRRPEVIEEIISVISGVMGNYVLDTHLDGDHNRSVVTFVGTPSAVEEAAFRMIKKASELINLDEHSGEHPRIGATDVVPFVPIRGVSMADCVEMAHRVGERVGGELGIPVFFYEEAALIPERKRLEVIRKGEYEELKKALGKDPARKPDSGPEILGPAGATVIGAREFLIAYNVNLSTDDESIAKKIAKTVRQSSGGLPFVKALGMTVDGKAQVSMNLTNYKETPIPVVVEAIRKEAESYGTGIHNSELVGLIPQEAMIQTAVWYTQMELFSPDQVLEQKVYAALASGRKEDFLDEVASGRPTPGGGSAAAYTGALAAGLVAMVARLTIGKKGYSAVEEKMDQVLSEAEVLRAALREAVEQDTEAFNQVMAAYRIPKEDPDRDNRIQAATLYAAEVPLEVARKTLRVAELALFTAESGNKNAITDAGAGAALARAALISAGYNVKINLNSITDDKKVKSLVSQIEQIEAEGLEIKTRIQEILSKRGGI